ncbi:helix-turn-helix domain-containing protein [Chelativorans alearense]|uniref:helix-turn-helix domain-containing protein n=1 Tax=Chelativorans alearense TaxID=2681495 RepID=UPI0013D6B002
MRSLGPISQIISCAKIAETGSFSKAARELNLTPSAVSKSLSLRAGPPGGGVCLRLSPVARRLASRSRAAGRGKGRRRARN